MRGSVLPAVTTPSVMIAVSLGSTGKMASRAGMTMAIRYDSGELAWRLVRTLIRSPSVPGRPPWIIQPEP